MKRPVRRAISKMAMCIQRKGGYGHPAALRQPGEGVRTAGGTEEKKLVFALASIANHRRRISGKPLFDGLDLLLFLIWLHGISQTGILKFVPEHGRSIPSFGFRRPSQLTESRFGRERFRNGGKMQAEKLHGRRHRAARRYFAP
ncbi:hypothetical protein [Ottowia cancrivicina]|nr:hypothetical protein [Ottowia sp. 10c7w1]